MVGTRIHADVDYYDQLGVARTASTEEIRHAYRSLVRLLHPDHQTDPHLKEAAEAQLRKLNRIHAILIDGEKRKAYDEYLSDEWAPPILDDSPQVQLRRNLLRAGWISLGIITVALVYWLGSESSPDPLPTPSPTLTAKAPVPQSKGGNPDMAALQNQLNQVIAQRDEALREVDRLRQTRPGLLPRLLRLPDANKQPQQPRASMPVITELPTSPAPAPPVAASAPVPSNTHPASQPSRKLTGFWSYVKPREGQQNQDKSLFPPEFIEVQIQEDQGSIKGRYRARYRITDKAIPPEVNFEITGRDTNGFCACLWRGLNGAHGQINMQVNGDHTMKFDWTASELGTQQVLSSGTAVLTRRPE